MTSTFREILIKIINNGVIDQRDSKLKKRFFVYTVVMMSCLTITWAYFKLWDNFNVVIINHDSEGQSIRSSDVSTSINYTSIIGVDININLIYSGDIKIALPDFILANSYKIGSFYFINNPFRFVIQARTIDLNCWINYSYNSGSGFSSISLFIDQECKVINSLSNLQCSKFVYNINDVPAGQISCRNESSEINRFESEADWIGLPFIWYNFLLMDEGNFLNLNEKYNSMIRTEKENMLYYNEYNENYSAIDAIVKTFGLFFIYHSISKFFINNIIKEESVVLLLNSDA